MFQMLIQKIEEKSGIKSIREGNWHCFFGDEYSVFIKFSNQKIFLKITPSGYCAFKEQKYHVNQLESILNFVLKKLKK